MSLQNYDEKKKMPESTKMFLLVCILALVAVMILGTSDTNISVMDQKLNVSIIGANGEPVNAFNGGLDVHVSDVHNSLANNYFHLADGTNTTLSVTSLVLATSITVTDATGFSVGDHIKITNGLTEMSFPEITNIAGTVFTLNKPLDSGFASGAIVEKIDLNIAVSGSLANPISFKIYPNTNETWHLIRFLLSMTHTSSGDDSKFGSINALTNGIVFRHYTGLTDTYETITVWQDNADIKLDMFDLEYSDKAGGGKFSTSGRFSIKTATGSKRNLNRENGDYLELLIQDDLTGLTTLFMKGQGHKAGE